MTLWRMRFFNSSELTTRLQLNNTGKMLKRTSAREKSDLFSSPRKRPGNSGDWLNS